MAKVAVRKGSSTNTISQVESFSAEEKRSSQNKLVEVDRKGPASVKITKHVNVLSDGRILEHSSVPIFRKEVDASPRRQRSIIRQHRPATSKDIGGKGRGKPRRRAKPSPKGATSSGPGVPS